MAIDTSTLEATLQTKFDNVTDPKEMLLLGKAYEATVGGIAVSDIEDAGAAQVATINSVATSTFKTVNNTSILGTGNIEIPSDYALLTTTEGNTSVGAVYLNTVFSDNPGYTSYKVICRGVQATGGVARLGMQFIKNGSIHSAIEYAWQCNVAYTGTSTGNSSVGDPGTGNFYFSDWSSGPDYSATLDVTFLNINDTTRPIRWLAHEGGIYANFSYQYDSSSSGMLRNTAFVPNGLVFYMASQNIQNWAIDVYGIK
jgi:hypothetical protein